MPAKNLGFTWNGKSVPARKGEDWMRADPEAAQAASTRRFLEEAQRTRQEKLADTMGMGAIATGLDIAGGVPQYLAGEALGAAGLDPVSLISRAGEATGVNPLYLAAGAAPLLGIGKARRMLKGEGLLAGKVRPPSVRTKSMDDFGAVHGTPITDDIRSSIESMEVKDELTGKGVTAFPAGAEVPESLLGPAMDNRKRLLSEKSTMPGRAFDKWTPKQIEAFGTKHGLDWSEAPMVPVKDIDPRTGEVNTWYVPGSLDMDKPWNYVNLHQLKHAGIDPKRISPEFHNKLHHKMTAALQPKKLTDEHVFQGLMFGLASPNVPLHDTQMILTRVRPKTKADWDKLESYTKGKNLTPQERAATMQQMMHDYGLTAGYKGGSGNAATNDLTRISELATVFRANPGQFRQQPGETVKQLAERMANIVPGLQMKTADMGSVWQDILKANSAPMDRHMADLYMPVLEKSKLGEKWKRDALDAYNAEAAKAGSTQFSEYKQLKKSENGADWLGERLRKVINDTRPVQKYDKAPKLKSGKLGKARINKDVPKHLRNLPGTKVAIRGDYYEGALKQNERQSIKNQMSLYQKQWQFWDAKRGQINPHEVMHPDLQKVPKMAWKDMHQANLELRKRGFLDSTGKPVTPGPWEKAFYYGVPAATGAGLLGTPNEDDRRD